MWDMKATQHALIPHHGTSPSYYLSLAAIDPTEPATNNGMLPLFATNGSSPFPACEADLCGSRSVRVGRGTVQVLGRPGPTQEQG